MNEKIELLGKLALLYRKQVETDNLYHFNEVLEKTTVAYKQWQELLSECSDHEKLTLKLALAASRISTAYDPDMEIRHCNILFNQIEGAKT